MVVNLLIAHRIGKNLCGKSLPNSADLQEFIDNTEILSTETVSCEELTKNVKKITFRSTSNGKTITMLTNGYISNANVSQESA